MEKYIDKCVTSILKQTFSDFELILVDDGSPDKCGKICDAFAGKDERIRVIHKENGGLSDARNAGLDIAKGEYISFIDSDDWVEPDMLKNLLSLAEESGADIACCKFRKLEEDTHKEYPDKSVVVPGVYTPDEYWEKSFFWEHKNLLWANYSFLKKTFPEKTSSIE